MTTLSCPPNPLLINHIIPWKSQRNHTGVDNFFFAFSFSFFFFFEDATSLLTEVFLGSV